MGLFFEEGWRLFHFKDGGGVHMGGLTKIGCEGGGEINFKTLNCILVLSFIQFSKIIFLCSPECALMSVLLYRSIKFPKFEHDQKVIYVHNFFYYFEYDDSLTQFRIMVVLITYVMQVFEFRFTRFTLI